MKQIECPKNVEMALKKEGSIFVKLYKFRNLHIILSLDPTQHGTLLHMSISSETKYPSWDDITEAKDKLMGDIDVMMILTKKIDYVNLHKNCFHLWETPKEWNIQ